MLLGGHRGRHLPGDPDDDRWWAGTTQEVHRGRSLRWQGQRHGMLLRSPVIRSETPTRTSADRHQPDIKVMNIVAILLARSSHSSPLLLATTSWIAAGPIRRSRQWRRRRSRLHVRRAGISDLNGGHWLHSLVGCGPRRRSNPWDWVPTWRRPPGRRPGPPPARLQSYPRSGQRDEVAWAAGSEPSGSCNGGVLVLPSRASAHHGVATWQGLPAGVSPWLDHPPLFGLLSAAAALVAGEQRRPSRTLRHPAGPPSCSASRAAGPLRARRPSPRPRHRPGGAGRLLPLPWISRPAGGQKRMAPGSDAARVLGAPKPSRFLPTPCCSPSACSPRWSRCPV